VMLARSLEQTEAELMKAARARDVVVKEVRQLEEQWERVSRQANATELEAHKLVSDRLTAEKGALNAKGEAEKTRQVTGGPAFNPLATADCGPHPYLTPRIPRIGST